MTLPSFPPELAVLAVAMAVGTYVAIYKIKRMELQDRLASQEIEVAGEQLTFDEAVEQRNAVLDAVAENNVGWLKLALDAMKRIPDGTEQTGEGFRMLLLERGLGEPRHAGAWGAFTGQLVRKGILVPTGDWQPMKQKASHGRLTRVYTKRTPPVAA